MDNFYLFIYVEISNLPTEVQLFDLLAYHVYNINFAIALFEELLPLLSPPVLISEIVNFIVACSYYWREVSVFFLLILRMILLQIGLDILSYVSIFLH